MKTVIATSAIIAAMLSCTESEEATAMAGAPPAHTIVITESTPGYPGPIVAVPAIVIDERTPGYPGPIVMRPTLASARPRPLSHF